MTPAEIAEIAKYAETFNQRFGQFLENAITESGIGIGHLFYMEDEHLMQVCREYYASIKDLVTS